MTADDDALIEAYLRYLRGDGEVPNLDGLGPEEEAQAHELLDLLDAITDMGSRELPDFEDDPVARQLGLAMAGSPRPHATTGQGGARTAARTKGRRGRAARDRSISRWRGVLGFGSVAAAVALVVIMVQLGGFGTSTPAAAVTPGTLTSRCETTFRGSGDAVNDNEGHVVVAAVWGGEEAKRFEEVLIRFSQKTGISVSFATNPADADRRIAGTLQALSAQGCAPDVALLPQPGLLEDLVKRGEVFPVDDIAGKELERNYSADWRKLGEVEGRSYGVWFKAANKSIIWYNANAFRRAGIESLPSDWEALKDVADKLLAAGITPFAIGGGGEDGWVLTDWFENVYLATAGGDRYDQLTSGDIPWTDSTVTHALTLMAEIFSRPEWVADTSTGVRETTLKDAVRKVFGNPADPEAAMLFEGDYLASDIGGTPSKVGIDARFFPFPTIGSPEGAVVPALAPTSEETGGDIAVLMKPTDAGERLIRFLATPEAAEPWVKRGGFISPNRNVDLDDYPDPDTRRAAASLMTATDLRFDLSDRLPHAFGSNAEGGMWKILQDFLASPGDIEGTAQRLEAAYRAARGS